MNKIKKTLLLSSSLSLTLIATSCFNNEEQIFDSEKIFNDLKINFAYTNKENTQAKDFAKENLKIEFLNNSYNIKIVSFNIVNIDNANGTILFNYSLEFDYKNRKYQSKKYTYKLTDFLKEIKKEELPSEEIPAVSVIENTLSKEEINNLIKQLNNFNINFIYENKEQETVNQFDLTQLKNDLPNEIKNNLNIVELVIKEINNEDGYVKLAYKLQTQKQNVIINSEEKEFILDGFISKNKLKQDEKHRLNQLLNNIVLSYTNSEKTLASLAQINNFYWANQIDSQAKLIIKNIQNYDNNMGKITLNIQLQSLKNNFEEIFSAEKDLTFSNFLTLEQLKENKIQELNNIALDNQINKVFAINKNIEKIKASSINKEDILTNLIPTFNNTKIEIITLNSDDQIGQLEITYRLIYEDNLIKVNSKNYQFYLYNFLTNQEILQEQINQELTRLNQQKISFDYANKEQIYAIDTTKDQLFATNLEDLKIIDLNILRKNNRLGTITFSYKLQSTKENLENLISQSYTTELTNFKQGLSLEDLVINLTKKANDFDLMFDYHDKNNTFIEEANIDNIYQKNNLSKDLEDFYLSEFENIVKDEQNNNLIFQYRLIKDDYYGHKIISDLKTVTIKGFLNKKETLTKAYLNQYLNEYDLKTKQEDLNAFNIKLYATSINLDNASFYLNLTNQDNVNLKIKNLNIDTNNLNQLNLDLVASKDEYEVSKKITINFENDFNERIKDLNISKIEELYTIDWDLLNWLSGKNLNNQREILNKAFIKKTAKINHLYDYQINWDKSKFEIIEENKNIRNTNNEIVQVNVKEARWNLTIDLYLNKYLIKSFTNLLLDDQISDAELRAGNFTLANSFFNKKHIYTFIQKEQTNITYKPKQTFIEALKNNQTWYVKDYLIKLINQIKIQSPQYKNITFETLNVDDTLNRQLMKEILLNTFEFETNDWILEEVLSLVKDNNTDNKFNFFVQQDNNNFKMLVKFTKENQEIIYPIFINNLFVDDQSTQLYQYISWIQNSDFENIWLNTQIQADKTHEYYYADQIYDKLNQIYKLPSFGEYELRFLDSTQAHRINNILYNLYDGTAIVQVGLFKNGEFTNLKTNKVFTLRNFQKIDFNYHLPNNNWFSENDFVNQQYTQPNQTTKDLINKLNSRNFNYNFVQASYNGSNPGSRTGRTLNPSIIVEQKAYSKLNSLLNIVNNNDNLVQFIQISQENDPKHNQNVSTLLRDYFIYYYDVQSPSKTELTFKLGFIRKNNPLERYATPQTIYLKNLYNDYELNAYPYAWINNLTYDDLIINYEALSKITTTEFAISFRNKTLNNHNIVRVKDVAYNNFKMPNVNNVEISDFRILNNGSATRVFIKLQYKNFELLSGRPTISGDIWYELKGFKNQELLPNSKEVIESIYRYLDVKEDMKKIFLADDNRILRQRRINLNYKDLIFDINKKQDQVTWLFKKEYYQALLFDREQQNAKIYFHFFTNLLYLDQDRINRIARFDKGLDVEINWDELVNKKKIIKYGQTDLVNNQQANFELSFELQENGIYFTYKLIDNDIKEYKIVGNNFAETLYRFNYDQVPNEKFDPNKAVYFNSNYGTSVTIEYENNVANEIFSEYQSNKFDYQNLTITHENMPFYIYNEAYNHGEMFKYNPNETLLYKWHEGYKLPIEIMHLSYDDQRMKNYNDRSLALRIGSRNGGLSGGSAMMLAKVSDDPNDGRYYFVTNNHVVNNNNTVDDPTKQAWTQGIRFTQANPFKETYSADAEQFIYTFDNVTNVDSLIFWTGFKQYRENKANLNKLDVDLTVFILDIKQAIENSKKQGRFSPAKNLERMLLLDDVNLHDTNKDNIFYFINSVQEANNVTNINNVARFKNRLIISTHRYITGFPASMQIGYIVNRNPILENREFYQRFSNTVSYTPILIRGGSSGTGIVDDKNNFVGAINSAAHYYYGVAFIDQQNLWNQSEKAFNKYNFFGYVDNKEEIWNMANKNSLAANIMKLNAYDPSIKIPEWIYNAKDIQGRNKK
ncbi:lipoprotein 17-related variable surface protein [Mycoplasma sp. 744]|uniref:MGA_1079 family surface serine endopeptidase n=1 Tax=Mycoplasma sp. 744 TaxID=3108531 RepID=UPI002B1D978F|nr:lipoprotein 17-related variable surface protein [Mycoplasma sp. 744]MEA4115426.1 lipoprotein 17-related variable surface protein [Mycoplasma sp. 744]